jgi:OmpA family
MKPLHLLPAIFLFTTFIYGQKTDTLRIFYKSDEYTITKQDKQRLDSFLKMNWDRISINGFTDEMDTEDHNLELSKKRSQEVYQFFLGNKIDRGIIFSGFFGETMPVADNSTDDGKALNRRTEIIGYQFARITIKTKVDPMQPVTKTLTNGFIITYSPGNIPDWMANNFAAGSGIDFQVISNTTQMQQNNLYNNTTNGEILSSVMIVCGQRLNPCKLAAPIEMKIPIPFKTKCPIEKVKFFSAVAEKGKLIWQEQNKTLYPETIDGVQYIRIMMDDFCNCINFDFKIDPECFDTDSTKLLYVNTKVRNLTTELVGLNSLYMPTKVNDSTFRILYLKDQLRGALISFSLYNGKRWIKTFRAQRLDALIFDDKTKQYVIQTDTAKIYFSKLRVQSVVLKVNDDRYKVAADRKKYDFVYLNRPSEKILVDFTIMENGRLYKFADQPLESLPFNASLGYRVINKKYYKILKQAQDITKN